MIFKRFFYALWQPDHPSVQARDPRWTALRNAHLKREPFCQACGRDSDLEVHHIEPVHVAPSKELDPANLITLCGICHLLIGHLRNWKSYNVSVRKDASTLLQKIRTRP